MTAQPTADEFEKDYAPGTGDNQYRFEDDKSIPALLETLNRKIAFIESTSEYAKLRENDDGSVCCIGTLSSHQAGELLAPYRWIELRKGYPVENHAAFSIWKQQPNRRTYKRLVFKPTGLLTPPNFVAADELNTWTGLAFAPDAKGKWDKLADHLQRNVCRGDETQYNYALDWHAQMFRQPHIKPGTAVYVRGDFGVGKTMLAEQVIHKIIGKDHSRVINNANHISGDFNAALDKMLFIWLDECGITPKHADTFFHLIANLTATIQRKGKDIGLSEDFYGRFMVFEDMKRERKSVIRPGDRRFVVCDVASNNKEDAKFFQAIDEQMDDGGLERFLYDLLNRDVCRAKMGKPPRNKAREEQIITSMSSVEEWIYDALMHKRFRYRDGKETLHQEWPDDGFVKTDTIADSYRLWAADVSGNDKASATTVGINLSRLCAVKRKDRGCEHGHARYAYRLSYEANLSNFEKKMQVTIERAEKSTDVEERELRTAAAAAQTLAPAPAPHTGEVITPDFSKRSPRRKGKY